MPDNFYNILSKAKTINLDTSKTISVYLLINYYVKNKNCNELFSKDPAKGSHRLPEYRSKQTFLMGANSIVKIARTIFKK